MFDYLYYQIFYEQIDDPNGVYVRGAYFAGSSLEKVPIIDLFILDPKRKVIFSRRK